MALRGFTDAAGVAWTVWETIRSTDAPVPAPFAGGWLTFESALGEKRRLAPLPANWHSCSDAELSALLAQAKRVARTPSGGVDRIG